MLDARFQIVIPSKITKVLQSYKDLDTQSGGSGSLIVANPLDILEDQVVRWTKYSLQSQMTAMSPMNRSSFIFVQVRKVICDC